MPETSKSPNSPSNEKTNQKSFLGTIVPIITFTIALAFAGSPKESKASAGNNEGITIELATALQDNNVFQYETESEEGKVDNIRSISDKSINHIGENFFINGQAAKNFNIERVGEKEYSIEYPLDSDKTLKFVVKCNYSTTSISFDEDIKAYIVFERSGDVITYDETQGLSQFDKIDLKVNGDIKEKQVTMYGNKIYFKINDAIYVYEKGETNGSISNFILTEKLIPIDIKNINNDGNFPYDLGINNNTYVSHISIEENPYKNEELIKNMIAATTIKYKQSFQDNYPELKNFPLNRLNKPNLGKEVHKDGDYYYRELYYKDGGDYVKVMNVYFDKTGKIDIEKTNNSMEDSNLFKKGECGINENGEFYISDTYVKALVQQLIADRGAVINMTATENVISVTDFPGLERSIIGDDWIPNPDKIISYNPIKQIIDVDMRPSLEKLHCKVENGTVIIVDETGKPTNNDFYYNLGQKYYRISIKNGGLSAEIIDKPGENPRKTLPNYLGDPVVKSILNSDGVITSINANNIVDKNTGKLIGEIPCTKEDGTWKVLDEYSINLNFLDLYNDESFEAQRTAIQDLCKELGIVDIDIRNIFKKKLENSGIDFNLKDIRIVQPGSKYGKYYKIDSNFKITIDDKVYTPAEKCFNEILSRLQYLKKINDCKILRVHGKEKKDFQEFIGIDSRDYESEEAKRKFIEGENDEIKVKIRRGNEQEVVVNYSVIGNVLKSWFTGEGKTYFSDQWYKIYTDDKGNIIFEVIEGKKDK